jgi:hypothetical protein
MGADVEVNLTMDGNVLIAEEFTSRKYLVSDFKMNHGLIDIIEANSSQKTHRYADCHPIRYNSLDSRMDNRHS